MKVSLEYDFVRSNNLVFIMDFLKIPIWLWLFLIESTVIINGTSTCEFSKYVVPSNQEIKIQNCFCFKKPGDYRTVPEILNQNNDNLERLVVYLYKDKITNLVKLYIPNEEKQTLVPDLAFEVGDNLNTLRGDKQVKDIFNIYTHSEPVHNNMPIVHNHDKQPEYTDGNKVLSTEITTPDPTENIDHYNNENLHVKPAKVPTTDINAPNEYIYDHNPSHKQPHSDNLNIISNVVPKKVTYEDIDDDYYGPNIDKVISEDIKTPNKGVYNNIHDLHKDLISYLPEEVNIPVEVKPLYDVNYSESSVIKVPSMEVNTNIPIPTTTNSDGHYFHENFDDAGINYQGQHEHYHTHEAPKQINIPSDMYINNIDPQRLIYVDDQPGSGGWNLMDTDTNKNLHKPSEDHRNLHVDPSNNLESTIKYPIYDSDYRPKEEIEYSTEYDTNTLVVENTSNQKLDPDIKKDTRENNEAYIENSDDINKTSEIKSDSNNWDANKQSFEGIKFTNPISIGKGSKEDQGKLPLHSNNEYETFDRWFIQQMQRFKTYTEHDRAINLLTVERYILKILQDNNMHVTDEGVLTDSYGTAIDVHNLQLRPILIGNPMGFESILKEKATDLVLPANMAYLQAILVTNSNPSMILGIIPIGKTVIPPSAINAFSTLLKPHVYDLWSKSEHQGTHSSKVKPSDERTVNIRYNINEKKPIVLHLTKETGKPVMLGPKKTKTLITLVKEAPVIMSYQRLRQPVKTFQVYSDKTYGKKDFDLTAESADVATKEINTLSNGNDPIESAEATSILIDYLRSGKDNLPTVSKASEDVKVDEVDEEDISGRIVGGSAATSSGAPLSMKGRIKDSEK